MTDTTPSGPAAPGPASANPSGPLAGRRILIVEDNALLAMAMTDALQRAGADIAGPVSELADAEQLAREEKLCGAMLDIRLDEVEVWPVARILSQRGVPFVFCSGHFGPGTLPAEWAQEEVLIKPAPPRRIIEKLASAIAGGRATP